MENLLNQEINIGAPEIISLTVTAILLFILPIIFAILWKKHCGKAVSLMPLFVGAAGFIVSSRILELGIHMLCIVMDNPVSRFINGNTVAYVLYGIFMAGIFEEVGRYIIIKFIMKKDKTKENMVMYGIGHGGIEVWSISLISIVNMLLIIMMIKTLGIEKALPLLGVTDEVPQSVIDSLSAAITSAANYGAFQLGITVLERLMAMIIHISLTVTVAFGIARNKLIYLFLAVFAHALVDLFPVLYQRGAVGQLAAEIWLCVLAVLLALWSRKLYKNFPKQP